MKLVKLTQLNKDEETVSFINPKLIVKAFEDKEVTVIWLMDCYDSIKNKKSIGYSVVTVKEKLEDILYSNQDFEKHVEKKTKKEIIINFAYVSRVVKDKESFWIILSILPDSLSNSHETLINIESFEF